MITTEKFNKLYKRLNPAQKQAVDAIEGAVMVIAGPGTGKTQILTLRIANILLSTQINPDNILALTFTESAVYEMRKRLVSIIGTPGYRVEINTFHGFCNDVIQNNSENFAHLIAAESISQLQQIQIIEEIIQNTDLTVLKPIGDPNYYIRPAIAAINDLKKEGVTVDMFEKALKAQEKDYAKIEDLTYEKGIHQGKIKGKYQDLQKNINKNKELLIIYKAYQKELLIKKMYDFNDMLLEVIQALQKDPQLLLKLQEKYQYFLVDEHQDTNAAQNKIIELLAGYFPNPNLFVVGDEKQAIFRFQGASLENFLYFKHLYKEAVLINLQTNYRSTQQILNAAESLIGNNQKAQELLPIQSKLTANSSEPGIGIQVAPFTDYFSEYYWIGQDIKKKIDNKEDPCEIAVLVRNNRDVDPIIDVFEQESIPYVVESDQNILQDLEIQKIILLLKSIQNLGADSYLLRAMHIDSLHIYPLDIYKLMQIAKEKNRSVWDIISKDNFSEGYDLKSANEIKMFVEKMNLWKKNSLNNSFDTVFVDILYRSGLFDSILNKRNTIDLLDKLTILYGEIKIQLAKNHLFSLENFLEYLELLQIHNLSIKKTPKTAHKTAVRVMTAHRSKGLEFDHVYIPQAYNSHWANIRNRGNPFSLPWEYLTIKFDILPIDEKNEDERRLFFVAITRARKEVTITYSHVNLEGREQVPSQFLEELAEDTKQIIDTSSFEKDFLQHKEIIITPKPETTPQMVNQEYIDNKKYFSDLFLQRGLSVSALNNYLDCPWKYFFRNLLVLPDVKDLSAVFGTAIHKALNNYLSSSKRDRLGEQYLLDQYKQSVEDQALSASEIELLIKKGEKVIPGYFEHEVKNWHKKVKSELVVRGVKLGENIMLNGRIDMIEPTGKDDEVIVHDFKTGKPKSRNDIEGLTANSNGDYKRQLIFYKILLDRYHDGKMKMVEGFINFVEPTEKGEYKKEGFIIEKKEIEALEETIVRVADEIYNFKFWDLECDDKDCEYCKLRRLIKKE